MPVTVNSVKDYSLSPDGSEILVKFTGKYIAEHEIKLPLAILNELVDSLSKIRDEFDPSRSASKPSEPSAAQPMNPDLPKTETNGQAKSDTSVSVKKPKSWMVTADAKINNIVIVVFDYQLPTQVGFGLDAKGARELSEGIAKHANSLKKTTS